MAMVRRIFRIFLDHLEALFKRRFKVIFMVENVA